MWIVILAAVAAVCAIGWLCYWVSFAALIMYMLGKNYTLPTEEESKACMSEVVLRLLGVRNDKEVNL